MGHWPPVVNTVAYVRFKACDRKIRWGSLADAEAMALPTQAAYRCGFCPGWHLTHRAPVPARSPEAATGPAQETTNGGEPSQPAEPPVAMSERGVPVVIPSRRRPATSEHTETPTRL